MVKLLKDHFLASCKEAVHLPLTWVLTDLQNIAYIHSGLITYDILTQGEGRRGRGREGKG